MSEIQAIDKQTVHHICSGQVILNLSTAVKELLENSLDAGATSIDIKLKEYGAGRIEVIDNGCGVEEKNFEGLTLKHHTSKLQDFYDLASIETFGFRGEALSSLCALCKMTITTRHKTEKIGHKLEYDSNGKIMKNTCVARQPGTSVILSDIFHTLPVRHKEFKKNIKKEYTKLLALLNGYCLISTGIRISCTNETSKGNKSTVLATAGTKTVLENISAVFGSKQCSTLLEFKQVPPSEEVCETFFLKHEEALTMSVNCSLAGYISSCGPGLGRTATDRQFFSINSRPCELQKVAKIVNEVFHMFNRYQFPFVQLDICTKREEVDVNVTPDKRQIFMQQEKLILAIVKTSLLAMFNEGQHAIGGMKSQPKDAVNFDQPTLSQFQLKLPVSDSRKQEDKMNDNESSDFKDSHVTNNQNHTTHTNMKCSQPNGSFLSQFIRAGSSSTEQCSSFQRSKGMKRPSQNCLPLAKQAKIDNILILKRPPLEEQDRSHLPNNDCSQENSFPNKISIKEDVNRDCQDTAYHSDPIITEVLTDNPSNEKRPVHSFSYSFSRSKAMLEIQKRLGLKDIKNGQGFFGRSFKAKISSDQNKEAEAELSKYFGKESFLKMSIVGQFNLGFVIAQHENDLFIIDQHAADEKYNFELLQKNTVLHGQPLIIPQKLELTAADKLVMQENADVFHRNGFSFKVEKDEETQQETVYLTKVPSSHNWIFEASDVAELTFLLSDSPNVLCRPSRVRKMFASRACRKSIMVGTSLTHKEMKRIVINMSEMDQPWNCPHGRPTMRHLIDLSMIAKTN